MHDLLDFLADLEAQITLEEKFSLFARFMADEFQYGAVNYGIYLDTGSQRQIVDGFVAKRHGLPVEWRLHYQKKGFAQRDPALLFAARSNTPLLQTQFYKMASEGDMPPAFAEVAIAVQDYVQSGVVIPVQANGVHGVIGLYDPDGDSGKHDLRYGNNRRHIETISVLFHRMCRWDNEVRAQRRLSDLNLTVLNLKARGLRVKEILHKIERNNPKTVDNHLMRVRKALGAKTDSEAIAKASSLGLLREARQSEKSQSSQSSVNFYL
ncbi:autoinducer binding domain-containing protein [Shimia marina]|uniref:LuxR family transcriptional regulatory, chaperone HchA-associated n=1 Tax=Shimia marina TaxID=321267 RepID=A0A0P1ERB7_9RHOB|nr:autoinducer binding domain-containing protein [Shimia marina]CUH53063.1 LuxR family transcriptional regulatory, chaperone HchA-associated [Shimia marina]SFD93503.1 Autoinducer binding domain-containing protein [Shimia marina]